MRVHLLLALLLCTTAVFAQLDISVIHHDSDLQTTYSELKTCSCGYSTDELRVKNIGDLESSYTFTIEADQPWFTLEKSYAYLNPGESMDLAVYTHAPCNAVGSGTYTVYASSEYGRYRAMEKTIETGVCQNIKADFTPAQAVVQPCGSEPFTLILSNPATFREHYTVEGLGFPAVTLDPDENATLTGWYSASCDEWGTKSVPVYVHSDYNGLSQEFSASITVPRAYDYTIALGQPPSPVCAGVATTVPFTLTNTESRANTFSVSGDPWSNSMNLYVLGNRSVSANSSFMPKRAGEREFTLSVRGSNGSIEKQATTTIPVEACYGFSVAAAKSVSSCPGEVYIPFTIESLGTQQQIASLDVQSNTTTSIDSLSATLNPSQIVTKTLAVQVPDADREYYVTLNASTQYAQESATTTVHGYSTESCYKVEPTNTHLKIWTDQSVQPIIITHTGIQAATYSVAYNGTLGDMLEDNITLGPGGQAVIHLMLNSTSYPTGRYLGRLRLSTANTDYTSDLELQLRQKGFWQQFLDACRWNGEFGVCSVTSSFSFLLLILVTLAILGITLGFVHYENPAGFSKQTAGMIGAALLILLLVAMIVSAPAIPRSYERDVMPPNESALYYEVGAGQVLTLDANKLFADPDNDTLSITANQPEHLRVRVDKGIAQVKADENYRGDDTLVFSASDKRGGVTDSELVRVHVVALKPMSFLTYWQYTCWFMTFLFLFITVALVLLTMLFIKDVTPDHEVRRPIVLYRKPRSAIVRRGHAQELVEQTDTRIRNIPSGVAIGQVIGTQNITTKGEQVYVASQEGTKFHRVTCPVVKGMPKDNRLTFSSQEDAIKAGYTPCKTCSSSEN